ncbi:hypothetical protein AB4Z10_13285 [Bosea sp. RAF48]|uniref:hypothetical protein n=1 Tax=Bosea sp. RAF48 TaxID=3237480 RepID=UPI003F8F3E60
MARRPAAGRRAGQRREGWSDRPLPIANWRAPGVGPASINQLTSLNGDDMNRSILVGIALSFGLILAGCQTSQSRQAQLAAICADPANRQPQSFYWSECQTLYPSSDRALQKDYQLGAAVGN